MLEFVSVVTTIAGVCLMSWLWYSIGKEAGRDQAEADAINRLSPRCVGLLYPHGLEQVAWPEAAEDWESQPMGDQFPVVAGNRM